MVENKIWSKDEIKELLLKRDSMVEKSIVKIYEKQTQDEQETNETNHNNGVGFNGVDANLLSSFAKQILNGRKLTEKQMLYARKKIIKYSTQLTKIANGKL
jgi:hypothetical protein